MTVISRHIMESSYATRDEEMVYLAPPAAIFLRPPAELPRIPAFSGQDNGRGTGDAATA
jgi:hypothetical protein